ncbi:unnamed protein product [Closterium sp. NIES-65]|nr:unnamed protein product [Closterium sp. NIES-65]
MEVLAAAFDKHVGAVDALECFPPTAATSPSARGGLPPLPELRCPPSPSSATRSPAARARRAGGSVRRGARWWPAAGDGEAAVRERRERHTLFHTYKRRRGAVVRAALAAAGVGVEEREGAAQAEWSWEEAGQRLREWRAHLRFGLALCLAEQRLSEAVLGGMGHLRQECVDDLLAPSFAALLALPSRLAASPPSLHALLHALSTFHALRDGYPQVAELYPRRTQRQRRQYLEVLARVAGVARSAFLATETAWSHPSLLALLLDGQASGQGKGQATGQGQEEGGTQAGSERGEEKEGPVVITALTQGDAGDGGSQQGVQLRLRRWRRREARAVVGVERARRTRLWQQQVATPLGKQAWAWGSARDAVSCCGMHLKHAACVASLPSLPAFHPYPPCLCSVPASFRACLHACPSCLLSLSSLGAYAFSGGSTVCKVSSCPCKFKTSPFPSPGGKPSPCFSLWPRSTCPVDSTRPFTPQLSVSAATAGGTPGGSDNSGGARAGVAACFQPITGAVDPVTLRLLDTFHLLCSHDLPYRRLLEEVLDTHPTPPPAASHASSPCASPHPALTPRDQQPPTPLSCAAAPPPAAGVKPPRCLCPHASPGWGRVEGRGGVCMRAWRWSSVGKLLGLAEVGAHAKHEERHRDRFLELSFARFHCLVTNDRLRRPDAIRRLVEFCAVLGDVLAMQQTWVVPDPHNAATLRSALRWGLQQMLQAFLAKHRSVLLATSSISEIDEAWQLISEVNNSLRAHT